MSFARWEAGCRRHLDGAVTVTTKAQRRERYAQDPDYRAKQRAHCRAYYRAHKQEIAALRAGRAGVTVRVEARSLDRLDADPAPAGDSAMRPMRNALDAQLRREGDDGEGGKTSILQLIARNSRPRRSPAMSRSSGKSLTAWMLHRARPRLRTSRREGDAPMEHRGNGNGEAGRSVPGRRLMSRPLARTQRPPFGRTKHWTVPASTKR
jgi:hypothetical protein